MDISISNVVNISISATGAGLGAYSTSNVAMFTREAFQPSFGDAGFKIFLGPGEVATDFGTDSEAFRMASAIFSQQPNILTGGGYLVIIPHAPAELLAPEETIAEAIVRTQSLVQYFGIISTEIYSEVDALAAAAVVQPLNKMLLTVSRTIADAEPAGYFDQIRQAALGKTRCLFYGEDTDSEALVMMAAYAGRAFSTNFDGANTTQTMHLKQLIGVTADPSVTETLVQQALETGADLYASIRGRASVLSSGANQFFDDVYNLEWFRGDIEVAGFNVLATTSTKIAQTESGLDTLRGAYRAVCDQAVVNQFLAPGEWTSPVLFGNTQDLFDNIRQRGYYIFANPVATQNPVDRENREAPLIQIAIKFAGAIHSTDVIININR